MAVVVLAASFISSGVAQSQEPDGGSSAETEISAEPLSGAEALEVSVQAIAEANPEVPIDQIRRAMENQQRVSEAAGVLDIGRVAAIDKADRWATESVVTLQGEAARDEVAVLENAGATVASGARFSLADQARRAWAVSSALVAHGIDLNTVTPVGTDGHLLVEVPIGVWPSEDLIGRIVESAGNPDVVPLPLELPGSSAVGTAALAVRTYSDDVHVFVPEDLEFVQVDPETLAIEDEGGIRGGQYVGGDGCTSGFSVNWTDQFYVNHQGYLTAGHCLDTPGVWLYDPLANDWHPSYYQWDYTGLDVGLVLSNATNYPEFWAAANYRFAQGVIGVLGGTDTVCQYGRKSNFINCALYHVSAGISSNGACCLTKVAVIEFSSCGGDSGGPYFLGTTMYGIHKSGGPAGSNTDCMLDLSTNNDYQYYQGMNHIRWWLGIIPN